MRYQLKCIMHPAFNRIIMSRRKSDNNNRMIVVNAHLYALLVVGLYCIKKRSCFYQLIKKLQTLNFLKVFAIWFGANKLHQMERGVASSPSPRWANSGWMCRAAPSSTTSNSFCSKISSSSSYLGLIICGDTSSSFWH